MILFIIIKASNIVVQRPPRDSTPSQLIVIPVLFSLFYNHSQYYVKSACYLSSTINKRPSHWNPKSTPKVDIFHFHAAGYLCMSFDLPVAPSWAWWWPVIKSDKLFPVVRQIQLTLYLVYADSHENIVVSQLNYRDQIMLICFTVSSARKRGFGFAAVTSLRVTSSSYSTAEYRLLLLLNILLYLRMLLLVINKC